MYLTEKRNNLGMSSKGYLGKDRWILDSNEIEKVLEDLQTNFKVK